MIQTITTLFTALENIKSATTVFLTTKVVQLGPVLIPEQQCAISYSK
jgi:hypothetical protein